MVHIQNNKINQWPCMHMPPLSIMSPLINLHNHPPNFTISTPPPLSLQNLSWSSPPCVYIPPAMNHPTSPSISQPEHLPHTSTHKITKMGSLPHIVEDCMGILQVFSDGTINRCSLMDIDFNIPVVDDKSVAFKDVTFDKRHHLSLRLYKPKSVKHNSKLPVVFYFHGGGFCVGSCVWPNCHNCCLRLSAGLHALMVAPDYRLAPEHKLPEPIDDAVSAVEWLQREALMNKSVDCDAWMGGTADFDRVFILGDSSGGNMAHHLAVRLGAGSAKLAPVRVRGYVLLAPFFGGVERTRSEEGPCEALLSLEILDR